jgi:DNA-directed RNA polymerase specialized sigma24 family protein
VTELVWLEGCSRREAARILGIAEGTLRVHETAARNKLRRAPCICRIAPDDD